MEDLYIIIGLGNPGSRYDNTRHNAGFEAVDLLAARHSVKISKLRHKALNGEGVIEGRRVLLVKPQTFMNLSGESVREVVEWYRAPFEKVIVVYDDIDIPMGRIRVRAGGSSGSHNGMKSVIYQLQSDEFPRVRIGIDKPPEGWDLADYVLSRFTAEQRKVMDESIIKAADAVQAILKSGVEAAMNLYNG